MHWGQEWHEAFEALQKLCAESPILANTNLKVPFTLHTDADAKEMGAVLYKVQEGK